MRGSFYEVMSFGMMIASLVFFYQTTSFLVGKDYLASILAMVIGFVLIRVGVEFGRLAVIIKKD